MKQNPAMLHCIIHQQQRNLPTNPIMFLVLNEGMYFMYFIFLFFIFPNLHFKVLTLIFSLGSLMSWMRSLSQFTFSMSDSSISLVEAGHNLWDSNYLPRFASMLKIILFPLYGAFFFFFTITPISKFYLDWTKMLLVC